MIAGSGEARRKALKICALATGMADKAVALFYERLLHKETSQLWADRCRTQVAGVLDVLDKSRSGVTTPYWFGANIGHADIAVTCALRFVRDAHAGVFDEQQYPALTAHAAACEAMAVFKEIAQEFIPPS
jgi:glutathione S-transferase